MSIHSFDQKIQAMQAQVAALHAYTAELSQDNPAIKETLDQLNAALSDLYAAQEEPGGSRSKKSTSHTVLKVNLQQEAKKHNPVDQSRYQQIVETVDEGIWIIDASSQTVYASQRAADMFGYTVEELMGKSMYDLMDTTWRAVAEENVERRQKHIREQHNFLFRRKDGSELWTSVHATPIFENGIYAGAVGLLTDITDRKQTEKALEISIHKTQETLESIRDAFFSLDEHMRVTYINTMAERLLKKSRAEVINQKLFDVFPEARGTIFEEKYLFALNEKQPLMFETYFDVPPYQNWYEVRVYPHQAGMSVYFQVITERKVAEEALRQSEDRYQLLFNRMLDAFALHEIICDEDGNPVDYRYLQVNPAFEKQTGLSADDILGKTVLQLLPDTEKLWIETYGRVALTGEPVHFENYSREMDKHYLVVAFSPQKGQFATIFEDITAFKQAEEALRSAQNDLELRVDQRTAQLLDTNQQLQAEVVERKLAERSLELERSKLKGILDAMPNGVYIVNQNCDIEYINPFMELEFGQLRGAKCYQYFHDQVQPCPWCVNQQVWKGESVSWEWRFAKNGKTYALFDTPLKNADGTISKLEIFHDITDRKQAEDKIKQRNRELAALNEIGKTMTSTLDLNQLLAALLNEVRHVVGAMASAVGLVDPSSGDIVYHQPVVDNAKFDLSSGGRVKQGCGIAGWVVENRKSVLLSDLMYDPRPVIGLLGKDKYKFHSLISVPLITRQTVVGVINLLDERVGAFSEDDLRLLESVASQAAVAIQNAQLFEAEQQARQTAEALRSASLALSSSLNIDTVFQTLLDHLFKVLPYTSAHIYLYDDEDHLVVHLAHGEEDWETASKLLGRRFDVDELSFLQPLLRERQSIYIWDTRLEEKSLFLPRHQFIRTWLAIPLLAGEQVIGLCTLEHTNPDAFTEDLRMYASALTSQAAVAIQNAWLFAQVRDGRERLQALSHRLVEIQELERRHIARELHDEAGQGLATLMVGLRLLERESSDQEVVLARCQELKQLTDSVLENLHRLAIDLRPASLDHLGLVTALRQHAEMISDQHELSVQFETVGKIDRLPGEVETAIYRIVQETLTNVVRHAKANRVDILMERQGPRLIVVIEDNGVGFDPQVPKASQLGMLGMRERADMLGGTITIESYPNRGTTIFLEIPNAYPNSDR